MRVVSDTQGVGNEADVYNKMLSTALPEIGEKSSKPSRFSTGNTPGRTEADNAVAPLLSRATLLKERGQWEGAITISTEAIRRAPHSAAAHSLLGDIYLAQGKSADALHWYRMALDRDPHYAGVADKYHRLLAEHRAVVTGGFSSTGLSDSYRTLIPGETRDREDKTSRLPVKSSQKHTTSVSFGSGRTTAERTLDWFERMFPATNPGGMTRQLFIIALATFAVVLAIGSILFLTLRKNDMVEDQNSASADVRPVAPPESIMIPPALSSAEQPTPIPSSVSSAQPLPNITLLDHLTSLNSEELTVTSAQADPKTSQVQLEIALAPHSGETVQATRNRILQAGAKVAQSAFATVPTLQRFAIRVLLRGNGSTGTADAVNANLVFVGEISGVALHTLSATQSIPDYSLLSSLFTNTWWANFLTVRMP